MTRIGMFQVGYQNVDDWGTDYSDFSNSRPRFAYITKAGPVEIAFTYEKVFENDTAGAGAATTSPTRRMRDNDTYALSGTYKGKGIEAGLLYKYYVYNSGAEGANLTPGVKQSIQPDFALCEGDVRPGLPGRRSPVLVRQGEVLNSPPPGSPRFPQACPRMSTSAPGAPTSRPVQLRPRLCRCAVLLCLR